MKEEENGSNYNSFFSVPTDKSLYRDSKTTDVNTTVLRRLKDLWH